jgi:hypothetical protein
MIGDLAKIPNLQRKTMAITSKDIREIEKEIAKKYGFKKVVIMNYRIM